MIRVKGTADYDKFSCTGDNYYKRVYFVLWNIIMV